MTDAPPSPADKPALRRAALARRAEVSAQAREAFALDLARRGVELARRAFARNVAVFWPIGTEVDTLPLLAALDYHEFVTGLPVAGAMGTPLVFRRWRQGQPLTEGAMRIPEPPASAPQMRPDLLFVPLAAFDRRGFRLGYGGGYYDATLARLRAAGGAPAIGLAFACQEIARVPEEAHDEPLDLVLTETETIDCALAWDAGAG
ncbi:MAG TPA: 5-formyltetrahydrofolate cyclo-ligase [Beijerinckiaceae bacterium]|jgi:5-formyltetrahydrofolate cyclo-ligase